MLCLTEHIHMAVLSTALPDTAYLSTSALPGCPDFTDKAWMYLVLYD